jgi:hypothetical protein
MFGGGGAGGSPNVGFKITVRTRSHVRVDTVKFRVFNYYSHKYICETKYLWLHSRCSETYMNRLPLYGLPVNIDKYYYLK